jgi:TonB-linked SusC/RagA family outer membrane protein
MLKLLDKLNEHPRPPVVALCLLLSFFLGVNAYAQITIKGTVTDSESYTGLPGTNVVIKGTATGTITDMDGNYTIEVPGEETVLVFSSVGYATFETTVGSRTVIDVPMAPETTALDEIVVVGYGTQQKVTVTGAVVDVKGKELVKSPAIDVTNSLAGRLAGVQVVQNSAEPGYDGAEIKIRGNNTLGNTSPLVVIDGIPDRDGGFGRLNPQDIESISVLKDGSAAIYGARAANGAIIVTTRRGKTGKPTVNFDFNYGWSQPTIVPEMSNAVEYANIINELPIYRNIPASEWDAAWDAIQTTGTYTSSTPGVNPVNATYSPDAVRAHGDGSNPWLYPDTDWFGDAFKTWSPQSRYDVQISGGAKRVRYFASIGYLDQDAYYKNSATFYRQYSARINLDADISEWFKVDLGLLGRREDRNFPTQGAGDIFRMLMRGRPTEPEVWPNGEPGPDIENGQNPYVVTTNATGYVKDPTDYFQSNVKLTITQPWVEGLKLELSGAVDYNSRFTKTWATPWELYYLVDPNNQLPDGSYELSPAVRSNFTDPRLTQRHRSVLNTNMTAILSYDHTFASDHTIGALIGVTKEQFSGTDFEAFRRNYITSALDQLFVGGTENQNVDGSGYERARLGYYGRVQYDFRQKYLVEFIWRYDGSYIFPEDSRFGFFPGILAGWNISNENFFDVSWIDYLKLRASYGQMGNDVVFYNDALQEFAFLSAYTFGQYPINRTVVNTLQETVLANPDFTWEKANNLNLGLDATFLNNSLDLTLEYFYNKRTDILIQETGSTPQSSGIADLLPPVNAGKVDNRGFEFSVLYNHNKSEVRWDAGINAGYAKNKVVFMDEIPGAPEWQWQEGKPMNAYLVYKSAGAFLDAEDVASNTLDYSGVTGDLRPGDLKIEDIDGNGIIDGDDQVRLDKSDEPTWNYGATFNLTWKGFDFSLLFQGAAGHAIRIYTESGDIGNYTKWHHDNRWSIDNPSSMYPRLHSRGDTYYSGGAFSNNTFWLFDRDYLRLKNLEIGYTVPMGSQNVVQRFRVYFRGFNLLTFAKNKIYDPEGTNTAGTFYPQSRIISGGFSIAF